MNLLVNIMYPGQLPRVLKLPKGAADASGGSSGSASCVAVSCRIGGIGIHGAVGALGAVSSYGAVRADGGIFWSGGMLSGLGRHGGYSCGRRSGAGQGSDSGHLCGCGCVHAVIVAAGGQHRRGKDEGERQNRESFHKDPPVNS